MKITTIILLGWINWWYIKISWYSCWPRWCPLPNADALLTLLNILNNIWASGKFPTSWYTSTVIPVPKFGKDTSYPSNYRPIAFASCICKVMECMINNRLVWYLKRNKLLSYAMQCGFHKQRSTTDNLVWLESFVREAFTQQQHAVGVFFDLDSIWKKVRGSLVSWEISIMQVCVADCHSS